MALLSQWCCGIIEKHCTVGANAPVSATCNSRMASFDPCRFIPAPHNGHVMQTDQVDMTAAGIGRSRERGFLWVF